MTVFRRILFPVDFSEQCAATAPAVAAMAKRFHSDVTVLHVIDLPGPSFGAREAAAWSALINAEQLCMDGRVALGRFIAQHFADVRVRAELREGDAAHQIVELAKRDGAHLIMLPTRGFGPFRRLLLGSVTAKVLHDASCPVWTGAHAEDLRAHPPERWKHMLCAIEAHPRDLSVLRWAAQFAAEQGTELVLIHAVEGADVTFTQETDPSMFEFLSNMARGQIAKMQAEAGTNLNVCLQAGGIGRAVHQAALEHQADLVLIGRGVMQKTLGGLRSNAYSIIREAPCPVLSI